MVGVPGVQYKLNGASYESEEYYGGYVHCILYITYQSNQSLNIPELTHKKILELSKFEMVQMMRN